MKKFGDRIIKIILVIIIILLLIHNCALIKKKGKDKVPSGNINIIEIICENNSICDKDNNNDKKNDDVDDNVVDSKKSVNNKSSNNITNQGTTNTNNDNNTSNNNTTNDNIEDDDVKVVDSNVIWKDTTELKIFENSMYSLNDVIAPEASNTYEFIVKNSTGYNLKYNISFMETNPYHINMKYKLKKNDTYLVDHYVSYNELNINEQMLDVKKNDTFYLEWKWVSSDNDNVAGENGANYQLNIEVKAESV